MNAIFFRNGASIYRAVAVFEHLFQAYVFEARYRDSIVL
jgi:hypothetical protein